MSRSVVSCKYRSYLFAASHQRLGCDVADLRVVFRVNTRVARREAGLLHCSAVTRKASCEPGQTGVSHKTDIAMAQTDEIARHIAAPSRLVGENEIAFGQRGQVENVVSQCDIGHAFVLQKFDEAA